MDGSRFTTRTWLETECPPLPVPVRAFLVTAIHGFAVRYGMKEQGVPALPKRRDFLPHFILMLHREDWDQELAELIWIGLACDPARDDMIGMLQRVTDCPGMRYQFVEALACLAGHE